jgi:ubiquinone/menaquinone biosynthesis C-methylase UbiE
LGKFLNIKKNNLFGCDIRDITLQKNNFNFKLINEENSTLPFEDKSIDFIFAFMTLHHCKDPKKIISEFNRILKNDCYLIIREHDCNDDKFGLFLDIVHGLYGLSLSNPVGKKIYLF